MKHAQRRTTATAAAAVAAAGLIGSLLVSPAAGAVEDAVPISQTDAPDNLVMLTAGQADRSEGLPVVSAPRPKYGYVTGFDSAQDHFTWTVDVATPGDHNIRFQMNSGADDQTYRLTVDDEASQTFTVDEAGWAHVDAGSLDLSPGEHEITLTRDTEGGVSEVKSMEVLRSDLQSGYDARVEAFRNASRSEAARFSEMPYGIMFQYGAWGYPQSGEPKSLDDQAADFDVPAFVDMITGTGAEYVIWSASWWTYEINAPIEAVDDALGHGDRTSERDLIGDVAAALDAEGIDFHLYYHTGQDSHLGYNSTDWWQAQSWPGEFSATGLGDRSTFFENWKAVVTEMGERYGDLLKGWFFDDGRMYYPGDLEELAEAARAGNPSRLLSYNNANATVITDFQDTSFGETCRSDDAATGGDGLYGPGAEEGLQGHCMYKMNGPWGVNAPDQTTGVNFTAQGAYDLVLANSSRNVPTSLDIIMWEDGTVDPATLDVLHGLKELMATGDGSSCTDDCVRLNDSDPRIEYEGGWFHSANRGSGDYLGDLHATQGANDSFSLTFTGSGVTLYMPQREGYSSFRVEIDGEDYGEFHASGSSTYEARVPTFSVDDLPFGEHTITATRTSERWFQLDYIEYRTDEPVSTPDETRPTVSLVSPGSEGPFTELSIQIDAADEVGLRRIVANIYQDGTLVESTQSAVADGGKTGSHTASVTLPDGAYTVKYNAQDLAGNISRTSTVSVVLDSTAPVATVKTGGNFTVGASGGYDTVSFKLFDAGKIDKVLLNGVEKDLTDNTWSDVNFIAPGVFGAVQGENHLEVFDVAGNSSTTSFTLN
ncbi:CBM35 domain-containing protein [Microbacterium sp. SSW1-59]|uniref:alpha-L-fucosidase n=1 Tax=Microbacterium xanthum TaxID=3079794 RepID=UPI002AD37066|nr:CBM35 domain-containing protein [Microbacterium sp. SSW1-59]MDZ8200360.1 CBM35 domain-containing protein [Microbacterium sp. SSW1-59]